MMTQYIKGSNGYDIPYLADIKGGEPMVVVVSIGFGSSIGGPTPAMVFRSMQKTGAGVIVYDFPAHGDSPAGGECLSVGNCMRDLETIENLACEMSGGAETVYFSSSFGAFICLNYMARFEHRGRKSFCRSAAVSMPDVFRDLSAEETEKLQRSGFVMLNEYHRPIKLTEEFVRDLAEHDVFALYENGRPANCADDKICMIHGEKDETIPVGGAERFAVMSGADLTVVDGAGHRLMEPGNPEKVMDLAESFYFRR
ncbi:MAG: alpha/beta hydrolase [Eubacteriaceae bacterium]|jgi:pimeloyl-ACP methyl ester carboxylesterase|nr:alpha/beta hydrolase [Eubacteriaceae bacterium]